MTIRVPKWLLAGLGIAAIVGLLVVAFILGRSSDDGSDTPPQQPVAEDDGTTSTPEVPQPPCDNSAAKEATLASDWPDHVSANPLSGLNPEPFFDPVAGFRVDQLECADLTGDGNDEMLVPLNAGAAGRVFNWAIFTPGASGWELAFHREGVLIANLTLRNDVVVEKQPTFGPDDALCCPSGFRTSEIAWNGSEYEIETSADSDDRSVSVDSIDGATGLGPLNLTKAAPLDALDAFGVASSIASDGDVICRYEWRDLGLVINFANLGGQDPCGPEARVGTAAIVGSAGEQAGWQTEDGLQIGTSATELRELYPDAQTEEVVGDLPPLFLNTGRRRVGGARHSAKL